MNKTRQGHITQVTGKSGSQKGDSITEPAGSIGRRMYELGRKVLDPNPATARGARPHGVCRREARKAVDVGGAEMLRVHVGDESTKRRRELKRGLERTRKKPIRSAWIPSAGERPASDSTKRQPRGKGKQGNGRAAWGTAVRAIGPLKRPEQKRTAELQTLKGKRTRTPKAGRRGSAKKGRHSEIDRVRAKKNLFGKKV